MTSISLRKAAPEKTRADALVIGVVSDDTGVRLAPGAESVAAAYGDSLTGTLQALGVQAKLGEVTKIPAGDALTSTVLVLTGLGKADDEISVETLRRAAASAIRSLAGTKSAAFALPADTADRVRAIAEGVALGGYSFDRYRTADKVSPANEAVILTELARRKEATAALDAAAAVSTAVNLTRDLVNTPASELTPVSFADQVAERVKGSGIRAKVWDETELAAKGYGGILGVGKGSANPPRLVRMRYKPKDARGHIAFVGKGITFDSGGLSLKPATGMMTMKCDMSGAAAVFAATLAIAELGLPMQITSYVSLAENMPSGTATRPGDILTMYGGKTVEVLNTDAEGRLVLADALVTASEDKPDLIVDVATLTGGCVVALGDTTSGVMSNDDELLKSIPEVAARAGEQMWSLPITEEVTERVKSSKIADIMQHSTRRSASTMFAAAFLREFVGEGIPWVHIDIAGTAYNENNATGYTPKGATGAAVRTLVQLATERAGQ